MPGNIDIQIVDVTWRVSDDLEASDPRYFATLPGALWCATGRREAFVKECRPAGDGGFTHVPTAPPARRVTKLPLATRIWKYGAPLALRNFTFWRDPTQQQWTE